MRILSGVTATRSAAEPARRFGDFDMAQRALVVAHSEDGALIVSSDTEGASVTARPGVTADTVEFVETLADGSLGEIVTVVPAVAITPAAMPLAPSDEV